MRTAWRDEVRKCAHSWKWLQLSPLRDGVEGTCADFESPWTHCSCRLGAGSETQLLTKRHCNVLTTLSCNSQWLPIYQGDLLSCLIVVEPGCLFIHWITIIRLSGVLCVHLCVASRRPWTFIFAIGVGKHWCFGRKYTQSESWVNKQTIQRLLFIWFSDEPSTSWWGRGAVSLC